MTIQELIDQFEIQGAYNIKRWDDELCDCLTLYKGVDFENDKWEFKSKVLNKKIAYMYAVDGVLNIEIEWGD